MSIKSKFHENKDWNGDDWIQARNKYEHQEQVPRKQGLKHIFITGFDGMSNHQEQVPRKQGLKQLFLLVLFSVILHQEQVPRKQGLKHLVFDFLNGWYVHIKSKFHENKDWNKDVQKTNQHPWFASRASSTKTRIETRTLERFHPDLVYIKSKFHENKDWNETYISFFNHLKNIKSKFHENKDWNASTGSTASFSLIIKSKFHENKDWNCKLWSHWVWVWRSSSRASSTKTRIETSFASGRCCDWGKHQEQVPRKQGLKLVFTISITPSGSWHQEQVPRKQGLKRPWAQAGAHTWRMENQIF